MAFRIHDLSNAPEASRDSLRKAKEKYGLIPNILGIMAGAPPQLKAYMALDDLFSQTTLSPVEQQVVMLSISVTNGCGYCTAVHTVISGMQQVPAAIVEALRQKKPLADPKLQSLRAFTAEIVDSRGYPSEESLDAFLKAGYTRDNVLEILLGVALKTLTNYTNHIADTLLDEAFRGAAVAKAG